jgi:dienelactone hydrolase
MHLMEPMLADRALLRRRLLVGYEAALRHPSIDRTRVAVIGYCFGGLCALDLARATPPSLRAVVSFHGGLKAPSLGSQPPIGASILLLHGWQDPTAPQDDVLAIARELTDAGADWQLHAYGHAMHAFTFEGLNLPERGLAYNADADRRSWRAMREFLAERFSQ